MKLLKITLLCAFLFLISACSTVRKTVKENTTTETQTIYKDTTVMVHLPQEAPQNLSQELFTNHDFALNDSIFNLDTLVIESYNIRAKAFISRHKLHLQTEPKDTAIQVNLKNAIRETKTQVNQQKTIEKQKNQPVILWVIVFLAALLWIGFFEKSK